MNNINTKVLLLSEVKTVVDNFEYDFSPLLERQSSSTEPIIFPETISVVLDLEDSNSAVACVFLDRPKIPSINTNFESMSATINTKCLQ